MHLNDRIAAWTVTPAEAGWSPSSLRRKPESRKRERGLDSGLRRNDGKDAGMKRAGHCGSMTATTMTPKTMTATTRNQRPGEFVCDESLGCFSTDVRTRDFHHGIESSGIMDGQLAEHFAVENHAGGVQSENKLAVAQATLFAGG